MKISVILGHPKRGSFNHAIAGTVVQALKTSGHEVAFHDLYREAFDPVLPDIELPKEAVVPTLIMRHCDEIAAADGIVIVHPNWWGQPPAIVKGWIDRVIRPGVAYAFKEGDSGEGIPVGLLRARSALVFNTSNTEARREQEVFGDPLERIWKDCIFGLCGIKHVYRRTFGVMVMSTERQREAWLDEVRETVGRVFS
ncbi:MAG: NAD(P)H-dependent oxidoreductase [Nitrospirae bacterium]|nr:NAD(P)H-dependent oxidoreductase [Nitrospirota bacterium]